MKLEIPNKVDLKGINKLIEELKALQTYKLSEDDDMVLVSLDDVVEVFMNHVVTINNNSDEIKVTNRNDTIYRQDAIEAVADGLKGIFVEYRDIAEKMIRKLPSAQLDLQPPCNKLATDTISRQAAIDALNEYFARIEKLKRRGLTKGEKAISLDTVGTIKTLSSAQPERMQCNFCGMSICTLEGRACSRQVVKK